MTPDDPSGTGSTDDAPAETPEPPGADPTLARITVYPVKSLDGLDLEAATVVENGGLAHDREFAIVDADGEYVHGKATPAVHRLRCEYDPDAGELAVGERGESLERFHVEDDRAALSAWLSDFFGEPVQLRRDRRGGYPDVRVFADEPYALGPTVISTATLQATASWFPDVDVDGMRRRLRANLEVEGVPPFWEDRLFAGEDAVVTFRIGDVEFEGTGPVPRCVVPLRDPDTGERYDDFQRIFTERREATLPDWTAEERFDHFFKLMVNTAVAPAEVGGRVSVGDEVEVVGERPRRDEG